MQDRVADVLAQRAALDRGPAAGVAISIVRHCALFGGGVYAAMHASPPEAVKMVTIEFASMPAVQSPATSKPAARKVEAPKLEDPKPVIQEPAPVVAEAPPPKLPEKNTAPMSPFGRSTKKGSEAPAVPITSAPSLAGEPGMAPTSTAPAVPIGGSGVTGLEGGNFTDTLYIRGMHQTIGNLWTRPQSPPDGTGVTIYFRIARDGKITDARVERSSGNRTFDRAALSAVVSASPLRRLPPSYVGTYLGVQLTFR